MVSQWSFTVLGDQTPAVMDEILNLQCSDSEDFLITILFKRNLPDALTPHHGLDLHPYAREADRFMADINDHPALVIASSGVPPPPVMTSTQDSSPLPPDVSTVFHPRHWLPPIP